MSVRPKFTEILETSVRRQEVIDQFFEYYRSKFEEILGSSGAALSYKDQLNYLVGNSIMINDEVKKINKPIIDRRMFSVLWRLISEYDVGDE